MSKPNIKAVFRNIFYAEPVRPRIFVGSSRPKNCKGYIPPADPRLASCLRCGKPEGVHDMG